MKKQHIARHDAMMRMLIKDFTKGTKGSHYLIADVGSSMANRVKVMMQQELSQVYQHRVKMQGIINPKDPERRYQPQGSQDTMF